MPEPDFKNIYTERFREWDSFYDKHFDWGSEDLLTILIKAHLMVEQHLTTLIRHKCCNPESLVDARLTFVQKLHLVKALIPEKGIVSEHLNTEFWDSITLLNTLRNDLAHELESKKLTAHLATLRQQCNKLNVNVPTPLATDFKTDSGLVKAMLCRWLGDLGSLDALVIFKEKKKAGK